jgi:hypothetical protein
VAPQKREKHHRGEGSAPRAHEQKRRSAEAQKVWRSCKNRRARRAWSAYGPQRGPRMVRVWSASGSSQARAKVKPLGKRIPKGTFYYLQRTAAFCARASAHSLRLHCEI